MPTMRSNKRFILIITTLIINASLIGYRIYLDQKQYGGWTTYPPLSALREQNEDRNRVMNNVEDDRIYFLAALGAAFICNIGLIVIATQNSKDNSERDSSSNIF